MSQPSSASSFQVLFNSALQGYERQTGTNLVDHPFVKQLEECDSVDSVVNILQEQSQSFREFRGGDGRLMKSLVCSVDVLYTMSTNNALGEGIGLSFPPAKAIFAGIATLLAAVKDINASYDALVDLFASFENFLHRLRIYTGIPPTPALTQILVKTMVELLLTLALATKQVKQGRFKKFIKKISGEKDIEAILHRLDRLTLDESRAAATQTLEVVCGLVQHRRVSVDDADGDEPAPSISAALESIQEIVRKVNKAERDQLQQNVRRWLSPPDPWRNHNIARESRHNGTGTWWTKGDTYAEWKYSGPSSLLWVHGKPGAGKSVICSVIIEDIRTLQKLGLASLAFFYCDFRDDQKKDLRGLLSSLLNQLVDQSDTYSSLLSDFYMAHGRGSQHAGDSELVGCLKNMLKLPGQATAYIIIDALDECPISNGLPSRREKISKFLEELVGLQIPNLRICVTSRPEADILSILEPLAFHSISLHGETGQFEDIAEYVRTVVHMDREMQRWKASDKQLVVHELIKKADGMFRWVFCQLVYLRRCIPGRIQHALEELPDTLDETYARALKEIDKQNWEYAHRLFQCVAASSRPLRADELAEFLAFDFNVGSTPIFLADWRPEDPVHTVLSTCSSLLAVVDDVDGSPVIQFAHFSVKEYLTSARLAEERDTISRFHISLTPAHTVVAQACLGALLHLGGSITKDNLDDSPLAEYAAEHWVGHTRFEKVSPNVQDGMKRLFDPRRCHLSVWVWIYDPEEPRRRSERSQRPSRTRATSLHYASFWGMYDIATFLIVERSQDVNARGFNKKETPLHVASRHGYMEVTQLLLKHGADTEAQDDDKCTPLLLASRREYVEVAHVLLEHGADREARDGYNCTPLLLASMRGYTEVARVLLEHGADKDAQDERGWSPLMHASKMGHVEVVRVLLKYGADMEARDMGGWTSLIHASRMGDVDIARVLLEQGADVKEQYEYRYTPLHYASSYGRLAVAQLLLKHGADVKAQNARNQTPLHEAKGEEVARLLIEYGADANALDTQNRTPLHQASEDGITEVVRVLLEHGVDANARDADNATPLDLARRSGFWRSERRDIEQLMLQIGCLDLCTGKRGSDFIDESDSRKRLRQDALAVRGGGSQDVIMTDELGNVV